MAWSAPTTLGTSSDNVPAASKTITGITAAVGTLVTVTGRLQSGGGGLTGVAVADSSTNTWTVWALGTGSIQMFIASTVIAAGKALSSGSITITRTGTTNITSHAMQATSYTGSVTTSWEDTAVRASANGNGYSPSLTGNTAANAGDLVISLLAYNLAGGGMTFTGDAAHNWIVANTTTANDDWANQSYQVNAGTAGLLNTPGVSGSAPGGSQWYLLQTAFIAGGGGGNVYNVSISEAGAAADTVSSAAIFPRTVSEAGAAADTVANTANQNVAVNETGAAADTVGSSAIFPRTVSEVGAAADTTNSTAILPSAIAEAGAAADTVGNTANQNVAVAEAANAQDTENTVGQTSTIAEAANAVDTVSAQLVASGIVAETGNAQDTTAAQAILTATIAEMASATDAASAQLNAATTVQELLAALDALNATLTVGAVIAEAAAAVDTVSSAAAVFVPSKCDSLKGPVLIRSLKGPTIVRSLVGGCCA